MKRGSCPLPPPKITPTLPAAGASLRTTDWTPTRLTWRGNAATKPSISSIVTWNGSLISFFIACRLLLAQGLPHDEFQSDRSLPLFELTRHLETPTRARLTPVAWPPAHRSHRRP